MEKGIYIFVGESAGFAGVSKKVTSQFEVFSKYFDMEYVEVHKEHTNVFKSIMWRMPFCSYGRDYGKALDTIKCFDGIRFIYIRGIPWDRRYANFIKNLREDKLNSKIILEIPTYPYGKELLGNVADIPYYFKDIFYRNRAKNSIDRIVTYSDDEYIYGVPTIRTMNGISVNSITPLPPHENNESIHLIAVAQFQKSHGYERIIRSVYRYYQEGGDRNVIIDLVGYGTELKFYKQLVKKYRLEEHIIFHGYKIGDDLEKVYENADAALGCFGLYKRGIEWLSPIKTREYLSYGLPVISGFSEDIFRKNGKEDFFLELPNDTSDINMNKIIEFVDDIYKQSSMGELRKRIHRYAEEHVDMEQTLRKVISYINL